MNGPHAANQQQQQKKYQYINAHLQVLWKSSSRPGLCKLRNPEAEACPVEGWVAKC